MVAHFTISVTAYLTLNSKVERRSTLEPLAIFPAFVFLPTLVLFSSRKPANAQHVADSDKKTRPLEGLGLEVDKRAVRPLDPFDFSGT
jgi:hypothetical protein